MAATGATANPFRYGGQVGYYRDAAGRLKARARELDVPGGRWLSRDPIGFMDGWNPYWYAGNNPTAFLDPLGLQPEGPGLGWAEGVGMPGTRTGDFPGGEDPFGDFELPERKGPPSASEQILWRVLRVVEPYPIVETLELASGREAETGRKLTRQESRSRTEQMAEMAMAFLLRKAKVAKKLGTVVLTAKRQGDKARKAKKAKAIICRTAEKVRTFDEARREAFEKAGMTDPSEVEFEKIDLRIDPATGKVTGTGTITEFRGPQGAHVAYDPPHAKPGPHHDEQHIGWQRSGKKQPGVERRGNIPYAGPPHPSRPTVKIPESAYAYWEKSGGAKK